jgi:3-phosphoshikimate 1-carboxyvinyltransferase
VIDPPTQVTPASVATYQDHRMAMSFAVAGLGVDGIVIQDPECVGKTFPGFFDELKRLSV